MNNVGICFSCKDRVELSRRSIEPLLQPDKFDLFIVDGSTTDEGKQFPFYFHKGHSPLRIVEDIRGGADAAIVHNLTFLLGRPERYKYIGLIENDVLMTDPKWFVDTMALFEIGENYGLAVGAVSPRAYVDRMLCQRTYYGLMHNTGAGAVIFTREAAACILHNYRTGWTSHSRAVFSTLSGVDIGRYWAFKGGEHWLTADWQFERILAEHGLASLALTPSPVEMIGQVPPLADQGLVIVDRELDEFKNNKAFDLFVSRTRDIRNNLLSFPDSRLHRDTQGEIIFPHQYPFTIHGDWRMTWRQGFGPFAWRTAAGSSLELPVIGPVLVLLEGGADGATFKISDLHSGFEQKPILQPSIFAAVHVPGSYQYRTIRIEGLTAGGLFCGVQCSLPQPLPTHHFDYSYLPSPE